MPEDPEADARSDEELRDFLSPDADIDQWLEMLHRADRSIYNMMALEVWSIAQTMDRLLPGFWNRFMTNRQISLQRFIQQRKAPPESPLPDLPHPEPPPSEPQNDPPTEPPASIPDEAL